ncbi:hypothetical protein UZ36_00640 [Candidatus Nitromaritima sp. SCGC AAA799-C22]|nr:hypothetical protein UZ36_00640 [Candidatus Nitromaritima sp. SCGC AAA799-C22]
MTVDSCLLSYSIAFVKKAIKCILQKKYPKNNGKIEPGSRQGVLVDCHCEEALSAKPMVPLRGILLKRNGVV